MLSRTTLDQVLLVRRDPCHQEDNDVRDYNAYSRNEDSCKCPGERL